MKKFILPLQIITIVGMVISMAVMLIANENGTMIKAILTFILFACIGVSAIIVDEKSKKIW
jgi:hypothetical protein